jgi:hypothetical protein
MPARALMAHSRLQKYLPILGFCVLLLCYWLIVSAFFPNQDKGVGHDYSYFLPALLDGYFWFRNNPWYAAPWFTPSFCGGQPNFSSPVATYYDVPMLLTLWVDPLTSVQVAVILFAAVGFWGMYRLLRDSFDLDRAAAFLGGALFMFNGFYIHRMIVGHLNFQAFMLIPMVAWLLLSTRWPRQSNGIFAQGLQVVLAGLSIAYFFFSGFGVLIIPAALSVLALACLYFIAYEGWGGFLRRSVLAGALSLALSASTLSATQAYLASFPRNDYLLPGFHSVLATLRILFSALFVAPPDLERTARPMLENVQWALQRHEWEYGITFIALFMILLALAAGLVKWTKGRFPIAVPGRRVLGPVMLLLVILMIPVIINTYDSGLNALLKRLPLIQSSSNLVRWWILYIPFGIVLALLSLRSLAWREKYQRLFIAGAVVLLVIMNATQDRGFYHRQAYDPNPVVESYRATEAGTTTPRIQKIGVTLDMNGSIMLTGNRNDSLIYGESQIACYNPVYGYRLEHFPMGRLHPGEIFEEQDGYLNLKNPACYLFPEENPCRPGDHFLAGQMDEARRFAAYKPFRFEFSARQKIANGITLLTLAGIAVFLAVAAIHFARRNLEERNAAAKAHLGRTS